MTCLIPGCSREARNKIGFRCRKPSTRAVWAPDTDAFLCKEHAESGLRLMLDIEPTETGQIETTINSGGELVAERSTLIKRSAA